jgi:hypothetical protein
LNIFHRFWPIFINFEHIFQRFWPLFINFEHFFSDFVLFWDKLTTLHENHM